MGGNAEVAKTFNTKTTKRGHSYPDLRRLRPRWRAQGIYCSRRNPFQITTFFFRRFLVPADVGSVPNSWGKPRAATRKRIGADAVQQQPYWRPAHGALQQPGR